MQIPFDMLASRLLRELEQKQAACDPPVERFFQRADVDLLCNVHDHRVSTTFGLTTVPHNQLVQNIMLSQLAGGCVIELKAVEIKEELAMQRPYVGMQTIIFNAESSSELKLGQSFEQCVREVCLTGANAEQSNGL